MKDEKKKEQVGDTIENGLKDIKTKVKDKKKKDLLDKAIKVVDDAKNHFQLLECHHTGMILHVSHRLNNSTTQIVNLLIAIIGQLLTQDMAHEVEGKG